MKLITLDCEQGSDEWFSARTGIITSTSINKIVTSTGRKSNQAKGLMYKLLAEHITKKKQDSFVSEDMLRGIEIEEEARQNFEFETGFCVEEVGGVYLDEKKEIMFSPDGLVKNKTELLEIKSPMLSTHLKYIDEGKLPTEYVIQCQSALWISGLKKLYFTSYNPSHTKFPIWILEVERDEELIKTIKNEVLDFNEKLNKKKANYESK